MTNPYASMQTHKTFVGADDHIGPPDHATGHAVGAGFYPARAGRMTVFTKPIGEFVIALREG